jgi:hypothetical protein
VIRDVDESLAGWLGQLLPGVEVSFEPPGAPRRTGTVATKRLTIFLASVRGEPDGSTASWGTLRGAEGEAIGRLPPLRHYWFHYLLVAEADRTVAEHEVLGQVLAATAQSEVIPRACLTGSLADDDCTVLVRCAPAARTIDPQHLWSAWGTTPRASIELSVLTPLPITALREVAPPPSHIDVGVRRGAIGPQEPEPSLRRPTGRISEG